MQDKIAENAVETLAWSVPPSELICMRTVPSWATQEEEELITLCFEPSQPQRIISGLKKKKKSTTVTNAYGQ